MPEIAVIKSKSQEMDKNDRIFQEYERLSILFEDLSEEQFAVLYPTLKQAAFMRITLEDLSELIINEGPVEAYQNGANQMGMKQSAALQSYNSTIKNYAATVKMLFEKLPRKTHLPEAAPIKTPEERRREDEVRQVRIEADIQEGINYQQWQREHPKEDRGFAAWKARKANGTL